MGIRNLALAPAVISICVLAAAHVVFTGLGGDASSVDSDIAATDSTASSPTLRAALPASCEARFFTTRYGTEVREFIAPSGKVFGVAWEGAIPPDLSVLLGERYSDYRAASAKPVQSLHHLTVTGSDLMLATFGPSGHLIGRAWAPSLVPTGINPAEVVR